MSQNSFRIAVEGCGHGTLHAIYASLAKSCVLRGWDGVDLLIICGDFQAVRNPQDLKCMSVPIKYRELGDFYEYYSGKRTAPYLTIFVGGNHEASNYLFELYYGGWVAPNIYYLGAANVLSLGGVRIAGLSGIWKGFDYRKPHFERIPMNDDEVKSIYHVRELDVRKLLLVRSQVDIGISHDWPKGIEWKGNWKDLFRRKGHFEEDARTGRLGSEAANKLLERLRPPYWFSAHLHIKYSASVVHPRATVGKHEALAKTEESLVGTEEGPVKNEAEIELDLDDSSEDDGTVGRTDPTPVLESNKEQTDTVPDDLRAQLPASFLKTASPAEPTYLPFPEAITNTTTRFLALDKCLPNRDFLQLLEIPLHVEQQDSLQRPLRLQYDAEWLSITRAMQVSHADYLVVGERDLQVPRDTGDAASQEALENAKQWVNENVQNLTVPLDFVRTAPSWSESDGDWRQAVAEPKEYPNPQTARYCDMLGIPNVFELSEKEAAARLAKGPAPSTAYNGERNGWRGGHGQRGRGGMSHRGGRRGYRRGGFRAR